MRHGGLPVYPSCADHYLYPDCLRPAANRRTDTLAVFELQALHCSRWCFHHRWHSGLVWKAGSMMSCLYSEMFVDIMELTTFANSLFCVLSWMSCLLAARRRVVVFVLDRALLRTRRCVSVEIKVKKNGQADVHLIADRSINRTKPGSGNVSMEREENDPPGAHGWFGCQCVYDLSDDNNFHVCSAFQTLVKMCLAINSDKI